MPDAVVGKPREDGIAMKWWTEEAMQIANDNLNEPALSCMERAINIVDSTARNEETKRCRNIADIETNSYSPPISMNVKERIAWTMAARTIRDAIAKIRLP